ncbi:MAG: glutaredoxin domain-containing protein [Acholeplasmataceae bacterium]
MEILVFGRPLCEACQAAREQLSTVGVPFMYHDAEQADGMALAAFYDCGPLVPVIVILDDDGRVLYQRVGPVDVAGVKEICDAEKRRKGVVKDDDILGASVAGGS